MKNERLLIGAVVASFILANGSASAQERSAETPQTVEGQVSQVDLEHGKLTIRATDGTTHEFQASRETLEGYKVGDPIKAKLRTAPKGK